MVLPDIVFLVPSILENMPEIVFYPSFLDGFTHAYESLIGNSATAETINLCRRSLEIYSKQISAGSLDGRYVPDILEASFLAGQAICNSETGPVHALSYPLSENFGISHGNAIGMLLPRILDFYDELDPSINLPLIQALNIDSTRGLIRVIEEIVAKFIKPNFVLPKFYDLEILASRSLELTGAMKNSPVSWSKEYSINIYNKLFKGDL